MLSYRDHHWFYEYVGGDKKLLLVIVVLLLKLQSSSGTKFCNSFSLHFSGFANFLGLHNVYSNYHVLKDE